MALYFLSYDKRSDSNYQPLYDDLKNNFGAKRVLESTWCFNRVNTNCSNLRDYFKRFFDKNDGWIVSEVTDWSSYGTLSTPNDL